MHDDFDLIFPIKTDAFSEVFSVIRDRRTQVNQRAVLDHYFSNSIDTNSPTADGYHKKITMSMYDVEDFMGSHSYEPDLVGSEGIIYSIVEDGKTKFVFKNSAGTVTIR